MFDFFDSAHQSLVQQALLARRSFRPKALSAPAPDLAQLQHIVSCAINVPSGCAQAPVRFVCIQDNDRERLADLFEKAARNNAADDEATQRARSKALKAPGLLAVVFSPDASALEKAPLSEQQLSAGAALGQFMLALQAHGFGGMIASGKLLESPILQEAFCKDSERLLCWIMVGTPAQEPCALRIKDSAELPLRTW